MKQNEKQLIDREQKKKEVEDILYQWRYFEQEEERYNKLIEDIKEEIIEAREKYPQTMNSSITKSNKISNITQDSAIHIIEKLDKKVANLERRKEQVLEKYIRVKKHFYKLKGDEKELIRLKYHEKYRGKQIYKKLNYSKRGYLYKKAKIIDKLLLLF